MYRLWWIHISNQRHYLLGYVSVFVCSQCVCVPALRQTCVCWCLSACVCWVCVLPVGLWDFSHNSCKSQVTTRFSRTFFKFLPPHHYHTPSTLGLAPESFHRSASAVPEPPRSGSLPRNREILRLFPPESAVCACGSDWLMLK